MMKLIIGTHNRKKAQEIVEILSAPEFELLTLDDFPDAPHPIEDADTFAGNAVKKATELADALGAMVAADDSGLEVDALDGRPGVYSARYGGEHGNDQRNYEKVLAEMTGVPHEQRTARFRCVVALAVPGRLIGTAEGRFDGVISEVPRGTGGFGYDPIFVVPALDRTCAELSSEEKHAISHRGQAFRRLGEELPRWLAESGGGA
jgi:XTP/dITP diphosphohydrolase